MSKRQAEKDRIDAAYPDRSAGRWCARCEQHGSHHTERHDDLLFAASDAFFPPSSWTGSDTPAIQSFRPERGAE